MIRTGKKFSKPEMSRVINGDVVLSDTPEAPEKKRLDHMMVEIFKSYNRSTLQKFIESGFVRVDGIVAKKPNQKFVEGAYIELDVPEDMKNADVEPDVIYEDDDVIVMNKPAGLLSEPRGQYCPEKTLADFGYIAHRLDRDTSGVVILAKTEDIQHFLKKQFQDRTVHKTYVAVVCGRPKLDEARIDLPLIRDLKRPTTFRVDANGKEAETFYKVLKTNDVYSMVELKPTTGRTHQLRVHMKYLGHPILGDPVYGTEKADRLYLMAREKLLKLGCRESLVMFFDNIDDVARIAGQCGTSIFVMPKSQLVEIKNAIVLQPLEKTVITIEQVRSVIGKLNVKQRRDQFIVIRPAELLQLEAANALLKSLEEPGDKVHFVLITDTPSQILPTILSRASLFILKNHDWDKIEASDKVKDLAKKLMVAKGANLVDVAEEICKKKEGIRAYAMEILGVTIEMMYKTYLLNHKKVFVERLPKFLQAYEGISRNGNVKLQIVANLC